MPRSEPPERIFSTSGQTPIVTFGSGSVIGLIGLWVFEAIRLGFAYLAPALTDDNAGFVFASANLGAALVAGLGRLVYGLLRG